MRIPSRATTSIIFLLAGASAPAQDVISGTEAMARFGADLDNAEVNVKAVAPGLYVLFGAGGNVAASIGESGVLIVDDQFPATIPKITAAIEDLGGDYIDFVINTHWHYDHTDGNPILGDGGSWIVSQSNSRRMMTEAQDIDLVNFVVRQPPSPPEGLAVITFDDRMQFHFNGEQIDLIHFGPAHTAGDAAVVFRGSNVVHMGDVFNNRGYPFVDAGNGGGLNGIVQFCESVLKEINQDTVIVPGHGPIATHAELLEYVSMLSTIHARVAALIAEGATLEDIIAARPTAEWDAEEGSPARLLNRAYASMTR